MEGSFKFTEVPGNIFDYEYYYKIGHCIGSDFKCESWFSRKVNERYGIAETLQNRYPQDAWQGKGYCLYCGNTFNLITKFRAGSRMTAETLKAALESMRDIMLDYGIRKAALPRIEEDEVAWNDGSDTCAHNLITLVFGGTDLEVKIVYPPQTKEDLSIIDPDLEMIHFGEDRKHIDGNTERKYY